RKEMLKHEEKIKKYINSNKDFDLNVSLVGSFRRKLLDCGDIDVILSLKKKASKKERQEVLENLVSFLKEKGYIIESLALGNKKFIGIVKLKKGISRRIDILITSIKEYPFALLYFTGSQELNVEMRAKAILKGYSINEYRIKEISQNKKVKKKFKEEK